MATKHSIIALLGKPNVGKSTIFNSLQKNDYAITSPKPQTTRNIITTFLEFNKEKSAILLDTPGFHLPNNKLDNFLNQEIKETLKLINIGCFVFDISRSFDKEDEKILNDLFKFNPEIKILIINKVDKIKNNNDLPTIRSKYKFDEEIELSAINNYNIDVLYSIFEKYTTNEEIDISLFKTMNDEFIAGELVRQSCINFLKKELPYAIAANVVNYNYNKEKNLLNIDIELLVEKESQKPIVIGKKGKMIKKIGIDARMKLLEIYDCKINLNLFVKVKQDWRNDEYVIKDLGYK